MFQFYLSGSQSHNLVFPQPPHPPLHSRCDTGDLAKMKVGFCSGFSRVTNCSEVPSASAQSVPAERQVAQAGRAPRCSEGDVRGPGQELLVLFVGDEIVQVGVDLLEIFSIQALVALGKSYSTWIGADSWTSPFRDWEGLGWGG
jgi:hypothetical protein